MANCRCKLGLEALEAKPKTADEINAEYDCLEFDLLENHRQQIADLCMGHYTAMENLRRQRMAELAEIKPVMEDVKLVAVG